MSDYPTFSIDPGTPEQEAEAEEALVAFLRASDISVGDDPDKAREVAKDMIASLRQQVKRERLNG